MEVKQWVKPKKLPFHGIAPGHRLQRFNAPAKTIDLSTDVAYEKAWLPLRPAAHRERARQERINALMRINARKKNANVLDKIRENDNEYFARFHYDK